MPKHDHDHGVFSRPPSASSTNTLSPLSSSVLQSTTSTSSSSTPSSTSSLSLDSTALSLPPATSSLTPSSSSNRMRLTTLSTATLSSSLSQATSEVSSSIKTIPATSTVNSNKAGLVVSVALPFDGPTSITISQAPSSTPAPAFTEISTPTVLIGGLPTAETQHTPAAAIDTTSAQLSSHATSQSAPPSFATQSSSQGYTTGSEVTAGPVTVNHATQPAAASDVSNVSRSNGLSTAELAATIIVPLVLITLSFAFIFLLWRKRRRRKSPLLLLSEKEKAMAEDDSDSTYTARPSIPQQPPPIIILPNSSSRNPAYNIGIDTSEALSVRGSSNGSYRASSLEEPPPPYHYQLRQSEPPRRTLSALPPGHLEEQGPGVGSLGEESIVSPFADPENDDAVSDLSSGTERGLGQANDDRASMDSDLSYQRDATRVYQTF